MSEKSMTRFGAGALQEPASQRAGGHSPERQSPVAATPGVNPDESPLAWLARRKDKDGRPMIAREEFDAGERLRADFHFANLGPHVTASWSAVPIDRGARRAAPGFGLEMHDHVIAARERFNRALHAVGPELAGILVDVCCFLKGLESFEKAGGYPQRSGKILLKIALQILARHYGLVPVAMSSGTARSARVHHWGAEDYRPRIVPEG